MKLDPRESQHLLDQLDAGLKVGRLWHQHKIRAVEPGDYLVHPSDLDPLPFTLSDVQRLVEAAKAINSQDLPYQNDLAQLNVRFLIELGQALSPFARGWNS